MTLLRLAAHCPRLVTVEVAGCANFTDQGFQALARVSGEGRDEGGGSGKGGVGRLGAVAMLGDMGEG